MRWLASSCGGRRYFSTLNSRRWKNNQFNARQTTQCVYCVRACSSCARLCCGGAATKELQRAVNCLCNRYFASMCAQFPNTSHTDEAPSERALFPLLLQRGFLPRCCSDNKERAHTQQQQHEKYMCVGCWGVRGRVVLKLAAIYQQQVSLLNTHLWSGRRKGEIGTKRSEQSPPDGASNAQFTKADDFCCTLQSDIAALAFTRGRTSVETLAYVFMSVGLPT